MKSMNDVRAFLDRKIAANVFPGIQYLMLNREGVVFAKQREVCFMSNRRTIVASLFKRRLVGTWVDEMETGIISKKAAAEAFTAKCGSIPIRTLRRSSLPMTPRSMHQDC